MQSASASRTRAINRGPARALLALAALVLGACVSVSGAGSGAATAAEGGDRVVAIGDLHGDLVGAVEVLKLAGLVDAKGQWIGGKTTLVQTGDIWDRGPDARAITTLLRRLADQAPATGGRVVLLLGNHEVMQTQGDWRYVDPAELRVWSSEEARKSAFTPEGDLGRFFLGLDAVGQVGDTVFAHGGVHPSWAKQGLKAINDQVHAAMFQPPAPGGVLGEQGPLWYRGFVQEDEAVACPLLQQSLDALGAKRMVVGHTTRRDGKIQSRCDGRLLVIDTGIAQHYGGYRAVLEIVGGDAKAVYPTGAVDLPDP